MAQFLLSCFLILTSVQLVRPSAVFELKVHSFTTTNAVCKQSKDCQVFFHVCPNFSDVMTSKQLCIYGTRLTGTLSSDESSISNSVPITIPFNLKWLGNVSLIIEAWNAESSTKQSAVNLNDMTRLLLLATEISLAVGKKWQDVYLRGSSELRFSYRVVCNEFFYGDNCSVFCHPRHDVYGHFICDAAGNRICLSGWKGNYCTDSSLTLTLKTPIQRELFLSNKVILQAVVTGNEREAVEKASVSCSLENESLNTVSDAVQTSKENSLFMKILNVIVNTEKWFDGKIVTCAISDKNIKQEIHFDKGDAKKPNVVIYEQSADDKNPNHVSLVCEVTSPQLGDVQIMWSVDGGEYKEAPTSAPIRREDSMSVLSILKVSAEEYEKSVISCAVKHANMEKTSSPLIKSARKSKPKCPECPHCPKDYY